MLLDNYWINELNKYKSIKVGFSGGLDSSVLLHNIASHQSLRSKLQAVHVNHGLSNQANNWQMHCESFCHKLNIPLLIKSVKIKTKSNLEEVAREARYAVFNKFLNENECLVLAHHQNDQVETLLFNLFRGTGVDGLAAIPRQRTLGLGELVRPLLDICRNDLYKYALQHKLNWIEDDSNLNLEFSRNYIRHEIIPIINKKWPKALKNISDCANKCSLASEHLTQLALNDCPGLFTAPLQLELNFTQSLSKERIVNVLRSWFKFNKVQSPSSHVYLRIINEVIFAKYDKIPKLVLGKLAVSRYRNCLYILNNSVNNYSDIAWKNFPNPLYLQDGRKIIAEPNNTTTSLDEKNDIWIRFRIGGECIKHNGKNKKLKKLLQELAVLPWERDSLPLLFVNGKLQAIIGLLDADLDSKNNFSNYTFKIR